MYMQSLIETNKTAALQHIDTETSALRDRLEFLGRMHRLIAAAQGAEVFSLIQQLVEPPAEEAEEEVEGEEEAAASEAAEEEPAVKTQRKQRQPAGGAPSREAIVKAITNLIRKSGPQTQPVVQTALAKHFSVEGGTAWNARIYNILGKDFQACGEGRGKTYSIKDDNVKSETKKNEDNNPFSDE